MTEALHPAASHNLPQFIVAPGETDVLMVVMSIILVSSVVMFGILFLRLHTLPERMAHRGHKLQFEIVAVLGLIALFTHMHIFWVAGLLLALVDFPDFGTSLNRIAESTEKIAGIEPAEDAAAGHAETTTGLEHRDGSATAPAEAGKQGIGAMALSTKPAVAPAGQKELSHV